MTRHEQQDKKTYIITAYKKICNTFNTIETQEHYNIFFNMCNNLMGYCNFWCDTIKPFCLFIPFRFKQYILYKDLYILSMYIMEKLQDMINEYQSIIDSAQAEASKQNDLEERMRLEFNIKTKIENEHKQNILKKSKPIGFAGTYNQLPIKKTKRKKLNNLNG